MLNSNITLITFAIHKARYCPSPWRNRLFFELWIVYLRLGFRSWCFWILGYGKVLGTIVTVSISIMSGWPPCFCSFKEKDLKTSLSLLQNFKKFLTQTKKSLVGINYIWNVWIINDIPLLHRNNKHRTESLKSCPLLEFGKTLHTSGSLVIGLLEIYVGNSVH